jgi:hypothetical protein
MHRFYGLMALLLSVYSCKDLVVEKLELDQLQSERLSEVEWDAVDSLPNPPGCDESENSENFSPCLVNFMGRSLIRDQQLLGALRAAFGDTLLLNLVVDPNGVVRVRLNSKRNEIDALGLDLINQLESLISSEPWTPGVKRGITVQVSFNYDLVLQEAN